MRSGGFAWLSAKDEGLPVWGEQGDAGAHFKPHVPHGIRLVLQQPTKLKLEDPLGADPAGMPGSLTILSDATPPLGYKAWYAIHPGGEAGLAPPGKGFNHHLCYAESKDGLRWTKPVLNLVEFNGSRENNIVFSPAMGAPGRGMHGQGVFRDDHADPSERYKLVYLGVFSAEELAAYRRKHDEVDPLALRPDGSAYGIAGAVSPDGIHWHALPEPLLIHHSDTFHSASYDSQRKKYVLYFRTWQADPTAPESQGAIGKRSVGRAVSDDFRHFSNPEVLLTTSSEMSPSHLWYGPCKTNLPGCPEQQVMFPFRWKLEDDSMDAVLFSTPDGWTWSAVGGGQGGQALARGQPGQWDGGYVIPCPSLIELPGERWALPYRGFPIAHKYPRVDPSQRQLHPGIAAGTGYAIWPKGRLVALQCDDEGEFQTVGVMPAGQSLFLNTAVEPAGFIRIAARTPGPPAGPIAGRGMDDCDAIVGQDGNSIAVTWRGQKEIGSADKPLILEIRLKHAKLFGLEFR
ncbi:MAG TPA: hypothetical protein VIL86_01900 [Tepidisphaeraceae bacterium]